MFMEIMTEHCWGHFLLGHPVYDVMTAIKGITDRSSRVKNSPWNLASGRTNVAIAYWNPWPLVAYRQYKFYAAPMAISLPVWLSSKALVSINVVTLRQARLVPGWVTILGG